MPAPLAACTGLCPRRPAKMHTAQKCTGLLRTFSHSILAGVPATKWHSCYSQLTSSTNKPMLSTTPTLQRTHFQLVQASFLHAHQLVSMFSTNAKNTLPSQLIWASLLHVHVCHLVPIFSTTAKLQRIHFQVN